MSNDYERIGLDIDRILAQFAGSMYVEHGGLTESIDCDPEVFVAALGRLARLANWVHGFAESAENYRNDQLVD